MKIEDIEKEKVVYHYTVPTGQIIYSFAKINGLVFAGWNVREPQHTDEQWNKMIDNSIQACLNSLAYYEEYGVAPHDDHKNLPLRAPTKKPDYPIENRVVSVDEIMEMINPQPQKDEK